MGESASSTEGTDRGPDVLPLRPGRLILDIRDLPDCSKEFHQAFHMWPKGHPLPDKVGDGPIRCGVEIASTSKNDDHPHLIPAYKTYADPDTGEVIGRVHQVRGQDGSRLYPVWDEPKLIFKDSMWYRRRLIACDRESQTHDLSCVQAGYVSELGKGNKMFRLIFPSEYRSLEITTQMSSPGYQEFKKVQHSLHGERECTLELGLVTSDEKTATDLVVTKGESELCTHVLPTGKSRINTIKMDFQLIAIDFGWANGPSLPCDRESDTFFTEFEYLDDAKGLGWDNNFTFRWWLLEQTEPTVSVMQWPQRRNLSGASRRPY